MILYFERDFIFWKLTAHELHSAQCWQEPAEQRYSVVVSSFPRDQRLTLLKCECFCPSTDPHRVWKCPTLHFCWFFPIWPLLGFLCHFSSFFFKLTLTNVILKSEWSIISIGSNSTAYSVAAWDSGASMLMPRYRWSIWYLLPGSPTLWKPTSQKRQRSQRCRKLRIRKPSMSCTVIKLSETAVPEGTFLSGAPLRNISYWIQPGSILCSPCLLPSPGWSWYTCSKGDLWQGWKKHKKNQVDGSHNGELGLINGDVSKHDIISGKLLIRPSVTTVRVDHSTTCATADLPTSFAATPGAEPFGNPDELSWPQHFK